MKIAIVGGGPAGLTTYLNLQKNLAQTHQLKDSVEITVYESRVPKQASSGIGGGFPTSRGDAPTSGGGYGLAPSGMRSLRRLDLDLHDQIFRRGFPTPASTIRSARGWTLGSIPFNDLTTKEPECCVMVLREDVLDSLYDRIPTTDVATHKVTKIEDGEDAATITLDNGDEATFDLVIGADGVWSKSRRAILGEESVPEYKGLFSVGGFVSTGCLPTPPETGVAAHSQTVMTFGPNGFFGYSPYCTGDVEATERHIRGDATLPPGKKAFWWSRSEQKDPNANPDDATVTRELQERHKSWKDPSIHKILQNTEVPLKIPTFVLPKQPTWAGKRVVLVGDAAHALPSSSGQGVSQSLEDAEALSLLLVHNLSTQSDSISTNNVLQKTFEEYMTVRKAHVEKILDTGNRVGDTSREVNVVVEILMYCMLWVIFRLFARSFMKPIQRYNVVAEVEKVTKQQ